MSRRVLIWVGVVAISLLGLSACRQSASESEPNEQAKTMADYEAEARSEINEDNLADELEKLEKEIEQDTAEQ